MNDRTDHFAVLAFALLNGPWTKLSLTARARKLLGARNGHRATRLIGEILTVWPTPYAPTHRQLRRILEEAKSLQRLAESTIERIASTPVVTRKAKFEPVHALHDRTGPRLLSNMDVARWLGIAIEHLEWFADHRRTLDRSDAGFGHYDYHWREKTHRRMAPHRSAKAAAKSDPASHPRRHPQPLTPHEAAYGFVPGRSCADAAAKHAGEDVVLTVDLRDFFLSTPQRRVYGVFRCLGHPHAVARTLTSLCTTSTPRHVSAAHFDFDATMRHRTRHLPQGAPTSPALANLAALSLDRRLTGLAGRFEARYTRYADDMTFSGDKNFAHRQQPFLRAIGAVVHDEGYAINPAKTRIMPRHTRQTVTGIVVNGHINIARENFDALKATLTNCLRHGPESQNRAAHADFRAHLDGRIAWVERLNLRRGEKLRRLFDAVAW